MSVALVTGASKGLGRALAAALVARGDHVVLDARGAEALRAFAAQLGQRAVAVPGDVADPAHRAELAAAVRRVGGLDLLVNNASTLGPSPQPRLADYPVAEFERVLAVNLTAPLALIAELMPELVAAGGTVVNVSSDAAVEAYEGWGGYGSAKAGLDHLSAVLAVEQPEVAVYAFDPGDMRTEMHQAAFPGEDISDRPEPESVVPALLRLLDERPAERALRGEPGGGGMTLAFDLPDELSASGPPEARGLPTGRRAAAGGWRPRASTHARFAALADFLRPGDLVVINTSPTLAAAVGARRDGRPAGRGALRRAPAGRQLGGRGSAAGPRHRAGARRGRGGTAGAARRRADLASAVQATGCGRPLWTVTCSTCCPRTASRSATGTSRVLADRGLPDRVRAGGSRCGERRDAQRRAAVQHATVTDLVPRASLSRR